MKLKADNDNEQVYQTPAEITEKVTRKAIEVGYRHVGPFSSIQLHMKAIRLTSIGTDRFRKVLPERG